MDRWMRMSIPLEPGSAFAQGEDERRGEQGVDGDRGAECGGHHLLHRDRFRVAELV